MTAFSQKSPHINYSFMMYMYYGNNHRKAHSILLSRHLIYSNTTPQELCRRFAFCLCLVAILCLIIPISFRVTSLALGQSYDCPSASEATLKDMAKYHMHQKLQYHQNKTGIILCMPPANGRRRYNVTYLIGQVPIQNDPCKTKQNSTFCIFHGIYSNSSLSLVQPRPAWSFKTTNLTQSQQEPVWQYLFFLSKRFKKMFISGLLTYGNLLQ